jgi:hypothetical protein
LTLTESETTETTHVSIACQSQAAPSVPKLLVQRPIAVGVVDDMPGNYYMAVSCLLLFVITVAVLVAK